METNSDIIINISLLLSLGLKFSPSIIDNEFEYFSYLLRELDNSLKNFNTQIFFSKINREKDHSVVDSEQEISSNFNYSSYDGQCDQEDLNNLNYNLN